MLAHGIRSYCQGSSPPITWWVLFMHLIKDAKLRGICRITAFIYCWGKIFTSRDVEFHLFWHIVGGVLRKVFGERALSSAVDLGSTSTSWESHGLSGIPLRLAPDSVQPHRAGPVLVPPLSFSLTCFLLLLLLILILLLLHTLFYSKKKKLFI